MIARLDAALVRSNRVAVLARTNAQLPPITAALGAAGVAVRRLVHGDGSVLGTTLQRVFRLPDANDLRQWAQDALENTAPDQPDDQLEPAQEIGRALLVFLRSQATGGGPAFRAWCEATDPFGRATAGVELLTFHAAKGREWHTVHLAGCETSLVPHRSATTGAARAEEARLLYVATTRATDELVIHWAQPARRLPAQADPAARGVREHDPATRAATERPDAAAAIDARGAAGATAPVARRRGAPGRPAPRTAVHRRGPGRYRRPSPGHRRGARRRHRPRRADLTPPDRRHPGRPDRRVDQSRSTITGAWSLGD